MNSNLQLWLDHPVTVRYRERLKEHKEASLNALLNCLETNKDNLLKGQINALNYMLSDELLEDLIDEGLDDA